MHKSLLPSGVLSLAHLLLWASHAVANNHHLFVSSYRTPHIFSLSYNNETNALSQEGLILGHGGHSWLNFNYDRSILYGAERGGWSSYALRSPTALTLTGAVPMKGTCNSQQMKASNTIVQASPRYPYMVYGAGRSPCGAIVGVRGDGSLDRLMAFIQYNTTSRIRGMALDPEARFLFSADQKENGIWIHSIASTGALDRGKIFNIPIADSKPRRLAMHPSGRYLYVLLRKSSQVAVFEVSEPRGNGAPPALRFTNTTIALLPTGVDASAYRASDLQFSADGRVLYGTVRYRGSRNDDDDDDDGLDEEIEEEEDDDTVDTDTGRNTAPRMKKRHSQNIAIIPDSEITVLRKEKLDEVDTSRLHPTDHLVRRQAANPGFLTAALLSDPPNGQPASRGFPLQVLMQAATSTTGGHSNVLTPSPFGGNEAFFALTDSELGIVQVWRVDGLLELPRDGIRGKIAPVGPGIRPAAALANIRVAIMAEWRAPLDAVGDPRVTESRSGRKKRKDQRIESDRTQHQNQNQNQNQNHVPNAYELQHQNQNNPNNGQRWRKQKKRQVWMSPSTLFPNIMEGMDGSKSQSGSTMPAIPGMFSGLLNPFQTNSQRQPSESGKGISMQVGQNRGARSSRSQTQMGGSGTASQQQPKQQPNQAVPPAAVASGRGCCAHAVWVD